MLTRGQKTLVQKSWNLEQDSTKNDRLQAVNENQSSKLINKSQKKVNIKLKSLATFYRIRIEIDTATVQLLKEEFLNKINVQSMEN